MDVDADGPARERRLRRAAAARFGRVPDDVEASGDPVGTSGPVRPPEPAEEDDNGASQRMEQQSMWAELQVRRAIERGDFDNLPGAGKPLKIPDRHDPDWWLKRLIEREKISGVAPPAIGLRREDGELDARLDREAAEEGVRRVVADFNQRVVEARRQLQGGPPVVTPLRDPDAEVQHWRDRRDQRRERNRRLAAEAEAAATAAAEASRSARHPLLRRLVLRRRPR